VPREVLLKKIAQEYWLGAAALHEAEALTRGNPFARSPISTIVRYQTAIDRQLFQDRRRKLGRRRRNRLCRNGGSRLSGGLRALSLVFP